MTIRPFWIIYGLAIYLPFEDFILKWLPVSENIFIILRQIPDLFVFSFVFFVLLSSLMKRRIDVVNKKAFSFLALFITFSLVSVFLNHSSLFNSLLNLKALIRYVFLIYILYWIKPTEKQALTFIKAVIIIAFIEAAIGTLQFFGGDLIRNLFEPRKLYSIQYAVTALRKGSGESFGTMAYTINYAFFLVVSLVFILGFGKYFSKHKFMLNAGSLFLVVAIFFSGSRAAFLSALIAIGLYTYYRYGIRIIFYLMPLFVGLIMLVLFVDKGSSSKDFWYFLSPRYVDNLESQRLGMIKLFLSYVSALDPHLLYGLSSDKSFFVDYISANYKLPLFFSKGTIGAFEDVYWIALIFYYGIIGFILFALFLFFIYKKIIAFEKFSDITDIHSDMLVTCKILFLLIIPLQFVNQTLEVRQFAFYMWAIVGFTLSILRTATNSEL